VIDVTHTLKGSLSLDLTLQPQGTAGREGVFSLSVCLCSQRGGVARAPAPIRDRFMQMRDCVCTNHRPPVGQREGSPRGLGGNDCPVWSPRVHGSAMAKSPGARLQRHSGQRLRESGLCSAASVPGGLWKATCWCRAVLDRHPGLGLSPRANVLSSLLHRLPDVSCDFLNNFNPTLAF
jgi:hypothetical protein